MKRFIVMCAAAFALTLAGCSGVYIDPAFNELNGQNSDKDGSGGENSIVGKWATPTTDSNTGKTDYSAITEFSANGKITGSWAGIVIFSGTYTAKDGTLTMSATETFSGEHKTSTDPYTITDGGKSLTLMNYLAASHEVSAHFLQ